MKNKTIAVVMGGPSSEREVSLNTGRAISKALQGKGYNVVDIDLVPEKFAQQLKDANVDVVFNALHGLYGEDGKMQGFLDMLGIAYTSSDLEACALSMNKNVSKKLFMVESIPTPKAVYLKKGFGLAYYTDLIKSLSFPVIAKSATQGSTIGVMVIKSAGEIEEALELAFGYSNEVVVEEFIVGREFTVAVIKGDDGLKALPAIEIIPHSGAYDYKSKYTVGATTYICPAQVSEKVAKELADYALRVYDLFNCCGVARVDYMMDKDENVFVLEINTVPGMTETSLVPKAAAAVGISFADLCEQILFSAHKG